MAETWTSFYGGQLNLSFGVQCCLFSIGTYKWGEVQLGYDTLNCFCGIAQGSSLVLYSWQVQKHLLLPWGMRMGLSIRVNLVNQLWPYI